MLLAAVAFALVHGRRAAPEPRTMSVVHSFMTDLHEGRWVATTSRVNFGTRLGARYHEEADLSADPPAGLLSDEARSSAFVLGTRATFGLEIATPQDRALMVWAAAPPGRQNTVTVRIDGHELGRRPLSGGPPAPVRFRVPLGPQRRGTVTIEMEFAEAWPQEVPGLAGPVAVAARVSRALLLTLAQEAAGEMPSPPPERGRVAIVTREGRQVPRLFLPAGRSVQLARKLPEGRVVLGLLAERADVPLEVSVVVDGHARHVLGSLPAGLQQPRDVRVDLSAFAGHHALLEFRAVEPQGGASPPAGNGAPAVGEVVLGRIVLLAPVAAGEQSGEDGSEPAFDEDGEPAAHSGEGGARDDAGRVDGVSGEEAASAAPLPVLTFTEGPLRLTVDLARRAVALHDLSPGAPTDDLAARRPATTLSLQQSLTRAVGEAAARADGDRPEAPSLADLSRAGVLHAPGRDVASLDPRPLRDALRVLLNRQDW